MNEDAAKLAIGDPGIGQFEKGLPGRLVTVLASDTLGLHVFLDDSGDVYEIECMQPAQALLGRVQVVGESADRVLHAARDFGQLVETTSGFETQSGSLSVFVDGGLVRTVSVRRPR